MTVNQGLNVVLAIAVLVSAMILVRTQYDSRRLLTMIDEETAQAREIKSEYDLLEVRKRAQVAPDRVQRLAKSKLGLRKAEAHEVEYVQLPESDLAVPGTQGGQP